MGIIDVSKLPAPAVIEEVDFEVILANFKADLIARFPAIEPILSLESAVVTKLLQSAAYRCDMLLRLRVNAAVRAVLPAFSTGTDLEAIAARVNITRLPTAFDGSGNAIAFESDEKLLERYLMAFDAPAAGATETYVGRAMAAWPARRHIVALGHTDGVGLSPGQVAVYLLAENGQAVGSGPITAVRAALGPKTARPMTDDVYVRAAIVESWSLRAKIYVAGGASPQAIVAQREAAVRAFANERYVIGGLVTLQGATSALWGPNVLDVEVEEPTVAPVFGPDRAPFLSSLVITYEVR